MVETNDRGDSEHPEPGLPTPQLRDAIQSCIEEASPYELDRIEARDRRGNDVTCSVRTTPLHGPKEEITGAILLMELWDEAE